MCSLWSKALLFERSLEKPVHCFPNQLRRARRTQTFVHNVLLVPWATPFISSVFIWRWLYNDLVGLLNRLLLAAGFISTPIPWLGTPTLAMLSVVVRTAWFGVPLMMVAILAGMQSIPQSQLDYARIEGTSTL